MSQQTNDALHALQHPERRDVLIALLDAERVDVPSGISNHHIHVPKLENLGLVKQVDGQLVRGERYEAVRSMIERVSVEDGR